MESGSSGGPVQWSPGRQEAQRRVYSLRLEPLVEVDEWLVRYRALWEQRLDALLLVLTTGADEPEHAIEATLTADRGQTILVVEERGMPLHRLAAYGAGIQIHVEDLAAHIAGRERCDSKARWDELIPAFRDLASNIG